MPDEDTSNKTFDDKGNVTGDTKKWKSEDGKVAVEHRTINEKGEVTGSHFVEEPEEPKKNSGSSGGSSGGGGSAAGCLYAVGIIVLFCAALGAWGNWMLANDKPQQAALAQAQQLQQLKSRMAAATAKSQKLLPQLGEPTYHSSDWADIRTNSYIVQRFGAPNTRITTKDWLALLLAQGIAEEDIPADGYGTRVSLKLSKNDLVASWKFRDLRTDADITDAPVTGARIVAIWMNPDGKTVDAVAFH
jgi:hypothetical protein